MTRKELIKLPLKEQLEYINNIELKNYEDIAPASNNKSESSFTNDINKLELYFKSRTLPTEPIKVNNNIISNVANFINSHLETLKANDCNIKFLPYLNRLQELKTKL